MVNTRTGRSTSPSRRGRRTTVPTLATARQARGNNDPDPVDEGTPTENAPTVLVTTNAGDDVLTTGNTQRNEFEDVIEAIIDLCGFARDSTMIYYIRQQE